MTTKRKISNSDEERDEHQETYSTHERGQCDGSDTDVGVEERVLQLLREKEELIKKVQELEQKLEVKKEEESVPNAEANREVVTIYVKKDEESVYNAVMLKQFTIEELVNEISNIYSIERKTIKHVHKQTKKGLRVKLDKRMILLFQDEDDFVVTLSPNTLTLKY